MSAPLLHVAPAIVPQGVLAFVPIARGLHDARAHLRADELSLLATLAPVRRDAFVAGRIALRTALHAVNPELASAPLLRTSRGAPLLPPGVCGSVSHKRGRAVALAAPEGDAHVGVDLEERPRRVHSDKRDATGALARRILTPREFEGLAGLDALEQRAATLLYFALKESVYKAIDPYVERYVRFTEVEIDIESAGFADEREGTGAVRLLMPECDHTPIAAEVAWWLEPEWIVAVAVARRS